MLKESMSKIIDFTYEFGKEKDLIINKRFKKVIKSIFVPFYIV